MGTGEIVPVAKIEGRIAPVLRREYKVAFDVKCFPEEGIEAGTDFRCVAYPDIQDVNPQGRDALRINTHLADDGVTIEPFQPEPITVVD